MADESTLVNPQEPQDFNVDNSDTFNKQINSYLSDQQFKVGPVQFHTHNASDSPQIDIGNITRFPSTPTAGDTLFFGSNSMWVNLAVGSQGALVYSTGSTPAYLALGTQGAVIYSSGTSPAYLSYGTSGWVLSTNGGGANPSWIAPPNRSQMFTASGTFTPATGISQVWVTILAGGGGGSAGFQNPTPESGAGGGSGGYVVQKPHAVTAGNNYTVTVGNAGAGGTTNGQAGSNGGNSVFDTFTCTSGGGAGASGGACPGSCTPGGGGGDPNGTAGGNQTAQGVAGSGGNSLSGLRGIANNGVTGTAPAGSGYGYGGAGGSANSSGFQAGSSGGTGFVLVQW